MEKIFEKGINELKIFIDMPVSYTAAAILIANNIDNELLQFGTFIVLFLIIVIKKHDSRIPIVYALIMLLISAFILAFQTDTAANKTEIFAYYLFCVGVTVQFIEYIRNPEVDYHENE